MQPRLKLGAAVAAAATLLSASASASTFQRLGTCPTLGCVLPPDQSDFLPGQRFDLRVEVHAPVNGSEARRGPPRTVDGRADGGFGVTIAADGGAPRDVARFFGVDEPPLERWRFSWYEDLFARDGSNASLVDVASRVYRGLALDEPGAYTVTLRYNGGSTTTARWTVRPRAERRARNVVLFIGDGMTTNMITAARLVTHKSINGRYQSRLRMDEFPVVGHQMTHSIDSYMTDSANSASALYSGHKCAVNAMGVHADSSPDPFDDPKVETIVEIFRRVRGGAWGAVSTAFLADATPTALTGHTRRRSEYGALVDQALHGLANASWTQHGGPDVYLGGGAEHFLPGRGSHQGRDYYAEFAAKNYTVSLNRTALLDADPGRPALGVFCQGNMPVWLDRNVYRCNLAAARNDPRGRDASALDLPGLRDMALKAVDVLRRRGGDDGFFLLVEAASIDKQMHVLDYDRALGDLLELDDTVRATVDRLDAMGILNETLVVVTADHGHGFDVWGSADTHYLAAQRDERAKRNAVGIYDRAGLSHYTSQAPGVDYGTGAGFPANWEPRYALAAGVGAAPDHREDYRVRKAGPRCPSLLVGGEARANPDDAPAGFLVNGTLPTGGTLGVHSLTDVPIYAMGPCQELFGGSFDNIDVFYKMAGCLGLAPGRA